MELGQEQEHLMYLGTALPLPEITSPHLTLLLPLNSTKNTKIKKNKKLNKKVIVKFGLRWKMTKPDDTRPDQIKPDETKPSQIKQV